MVAQQLFHQVVLGLLEGRVVGVAAEDVLEEGLQLVDVGVHFAPEGEVVGAILGDVSFLLFLALVEVFPQVLDDPIEVVSVLLPELVEAGSFALGDRQDDFPHLEPLLSQFLDLVVMIMLLVDGEVSFCLVESHVGAKDVVIFEEGFLDVSEGHFFLFFDR